MSIRNNSARAPEAAPATGVIASAWPEAIATSISPPVPPREDTAGASRRHAAGSRPLRVLFVDDEPRLRTLTTRLLTPHEVIATGSVDEALGVLAVDAAFDAVVCDVSMPGRLGTELYVDLQRLHPGLAARFVFASGGAVSPVSQAMLSSMPADRVLVKPYSRDQIRAVVERVGGPDAAGTL